MDKLSFFLATSSVLVLLGVGMQLWFAAGLFVLATSIFIAVGAFTSSYVSVVLGWPLPIAAIVALVATAALALCLVPLLFRLTGIYLAMASLAASEIIRLVAINLEWLTGGADGRIVPRAISAQQAMLVAAGALALSWWLQRSTRGERLELLRHDRRVAVSLALPVRRWESSFFVAGALVTASAGVVLAHFVRFTSPQQFGVHYAIDAI
ncbi:MAG: branched-chain amino acid ABC transporter permease, partial [Acidimicrobiales bacterium]|nr:branched-chain amino acid ABC transporter permease [Acidimicrobiales bacterium]